MGMHFTSTYIMLGPEHIKGSKHQTLFVSLLCLVPTLHFHRTCLKKPSHDPKMINVSWIFQGRSVLNLVPSQPGSQKNK